MLTKLSVTNDQGHDIPVTVSYESVGREVCWLAQFSGTTHAMGELAGSVADEGSVPAAVQHALLQAGVLVRGKARRTD
jgi:hypothetical protein